MTTSTKIRRVGLLGSACIGTLLLVACGPDTSGSGSNNGPGAVGGGPSSGTTSSSITAMWATGSGGTENPALASSIANSSEFLNVDVDLVTRAGSNPHPYLLTKVHTARSTGVSGKNKIIAVFDDGFLSTHEEFSGKNIFQLAGSDISPKSGSSHGTHVASIAAGNQGSGDIVGVAPDADLYLHSAFRSSIGDLAVATLDAKTKGAIVQNNSWGWDKSITEAQAQMAGGASAAQAMNKLVNGGTADWQSYIDSLDSFQTQGVIVFANANSNLGDVDITAGLPLLAPQLEEAWITVSEAAFSVDSNYNITGARLLSSPCGQAARFCLVGDGQTKGASAVANNAYASGFGTSYTAPQVSGAVALLAEAFPTLQPGEWRNRLLASANNTFFAIDGTTNFGGGVTHGYSNIFGHGVMNVAAALQPIGQVSVVRGTHLSSGVRSSFSDASISTGASYGDGLSRLLREQEMAVFDALNGNFNMRADYFVNQSDNAYQSPSFERLKNKGQARTALSFGDETGAVDNVLYFGAQDGLAQLQTDLGLTNHLAPNTSLLSFAETATALYQNHETDFGELGFYGFSAQHSENLDGSLSGAGASAKFEFGQTSLRLGFNQMVEQGAFLGMVGNDVFNTPTLANAQSANLSFQSELANDVTLFSGAELGRAVGEASGNGFVSQFDGARFSGFHFGVAKANLLQKGDRITLSLSQPIRVDSGTVTMNLPVGRDKEGNILYKEVTGNLSPSGREIDIAASYFMQTDAFSTLQFDVMYALDAGHVAGERSYGFGASFKRDLN